MKKIGLFFWKYSFGIVIALMLSVLLIAILSNKTTSQYFLEIIYPWIAAAVLLLGLFKMNPHNGDGWFCIIGIVGTGLFVILISKILLFLPLILIGIAIIFSFLKLKNVEM